MSCPPWAAGVLNGYYNERIQSLRECNQHEWRRQMKKVTGQSSRPELLSVTNTAEGGDTQLLSNLVNSSLQPASNDLLPFPPEWLFGINDAANSAVNEYIIEPFEVLNELPRIRVHEPLRTRWYPELISAPFCLCHFGADLSHI
jgi:hypothetical protein